MSRVITKAYLGVDGGGTKTALAVITRTGELLASLRAPTFYYLEAGNTEGPAMVGRVLGAAIPEVCAAAGVRPDELGFAFIGLPGYGEVSGDLDTLDALPQKVLGHSRFRCGNDMICGWAGSLGLADGINVVSGTGSICYGQRGSASARAGGWGEVIGDEGSGYWIGVRALQAATRMSDGRQPVGPLLAMITDELGLAAPLDLVDVVHNRWAGDRGRIAGLTPLVAEAVRRGDVAATAIMVAAATELALLVETTRSALDFAPGETVPLSCSGGVFGAAELRAEFGRQIEASAVDYQLRPALLSPVLGAAAYAAQLADDPLTATALQTLATVQKVSAR